MARTKTFVCLGLFLSVFGIGNVLGDDYLPKAKDITWSSHNFKTLLSWNPIPTNYSYTVELYGTGTEGERNPNCIQSMSTECDLTKLFPELKRTYYADVLSETLPGFTVDLVEFPYTRSESFCPYTDTLIGRPDFEIKDSEEESKITLHIIDPLSAIYHAERLLNMRDIFKEDLTYRVVYRKAKSTGRKIQTTETNHIELEVDRGESYCFSVQAYIPSRSRDMQLGDLSHVKCSEARQPSILDEYGIPVLAGTCFIILLLIIAVCAMIMACCKCCQRAKEEEKGKPLEIV
ncbi:tissue factor-like [Paramormyrops kingsleyae]|uniref:Tissue factor n=1 Tax=Paramormyrops kingsleyae TaxID=1676925 RepID=A0A3B3T2I0_9TELE|nr:tissue factor-like [Paramormyrops kingsleyae]